MYLDACLWTKDTVKLLYAIITCVKIISAKSITVHVFNMHSLIIMCNIAFLVHLKYYMHLVGNYIFIEICGSIFYRGFCKCTFSIWLLSVTNEPVQQNYKSRGGLGAGECCIVCHDPHGTVSLLSQEQELQDVTLEPEMIQTHRRLNCRRRKHLIQKLLPFLQTDLAHST